MYMFSANIVCVTQAYTTRLTNITDIYDFKEKLLAVSSELNSDTPIYRLDYNHVYNNCLQVAITSQTKSCCNKWNRI